LHPSNENIAWVAALGHLYSPSKERGVYKTTDGGKTWKQTLFIDDTTGAIDIDVNPKDPNELYAAMWSRSRSAWKFRESGVTSGIYKSNDGGDTWKKISGDGSGFMKGGKIGRIGVAVYPGNPSIVYAIVDNNMIKPDTGTKTADTFYHRKDFKDISEDAFLLLDQKKLDSFLKENDFPEKYTAAVVMDMVKTKKVKPTALYDYLDFDDGFRNAGIYGAEIYRSNDAGATWKKMNEKGLKGLFEDKFEMGGEASVSAGPIGRNAAASTNATFDAEILTYSMSKGAFIGASLKGAVITQDDDLNRGIYGKTAKELLLRDGVVADQAPEDLQGFPKIVGRFSK